MCVDADLGGRVQRVPVGTDPFAYAVHGEPAAGVGDVHAVRPVRLHQPCLGGEFGGGGQVAHHQEPGDVHAEVTGLGDVLRGDVGLGAVGGDANRADTEGVGAFQFGDGADAGEEEGGEDGAGEVLGRRLDPLLVGVAARTVVDRAAGQAVAVGDLDRVDPGGVERRDDPPHVGGVDAVPDGVHAVPQGDVLDVQLARHGRASAGTASRRAIDSATRSAADVMMSRFPA